MIILERMLMVVLAVPAPFPRRDCCRGRSSSAADEQDTHITAFSDQAPLPLETATVTPDQREIDRLQTISERLSPVFQPERIIARQACFRPLTQDGLPLIGRLPQNEGAYV